jgi:hypothetical protein
VVGSPTARVAALAVVTLLLALLATGAFVAGAQSPSPALPEEEAAPQPPVEFTGVWCIGPPAADRASAWRNAVSMSDPRLQGDASQTYETHSYPGISLISSTLSIVNEDGAWVSRRYRSTGTPAGDTDSGVVFIGEGAYEGLIAFMLEDGPEVPRPEEIPSEFAATCNETQGVIIDGAVAKPYIP